MLDDYFPPPVWQPPYLPQQAEVIRQEIQADDGRKILILCCGGKGGVGKTMTAVQIIDFAGELGDVLAVDADPANKHLLQAIMSETAAGAMVPRLPGIGAIARRLRAEDHAGRIDPTAFMDLMGEVEEAAERIIVVDMPAGDTESTRRSAEIVTETCRESNIRLVVIVTVGSVDPTPVGVLNDLRMLLTSCDRAVLVKNAAQSLNFEYIERSPIYEYLSQQPHFRVVEMEKIGERLLEALRVFHIPWRTLATSSPMRIRVEAKRMRRDFHLLWREALR